MLIKRKKRRNITAIIGMEEKESPSPISRLSPYLSPPATITPATYSYDPEVVDDIITLLSIGHSRSAACSINRITETVLNYWIMTIPSLQARLEIAEGLAEAKMEGRVIAAAETDPKYAQWILSNRFGKDWRQSSEINLKNLTNEQLISLLSQRPQQSIQTALSAAQMSSLRSDGLNNEQSGLQQNNQRALSAGSTIPSTPTEVGRPNSSLKPESFNKSEDSEENSSNNARTKKRRKRNTNANANA